MIKDAVKKVAAKKGLSSGEMARVFGEIMGGEAAADDVRAFLLALRDKGESPDEIFAAAKVMREKAVRVDVSGMDVIDTCGTGGAPVNDANISTINAIVLAACGLKVAKHGNRSFTGKCGSADILEALGVNIGNGPEDVARLIRDIGVGFIFAKNYHPAMKNVMAVRRELKTRTIFNILGPLSNPAGAGMQVLGVYKPELTEVMAEALKKLGSTAAYVVHGTEGIDEISVKGETRVSELKDGNIRTYSVKPADFGMKEAVSLDGIRGGDCGYNKGVALDLLGGKKGSVRDMALINAAAALKMAGRANDFKEGVKIAAECIDTGKAFAKLEEWKRVSNR